MHLIYQVPFIMNTNVIESHEIGESIKKILHLARSYCAKKTICNDQRARLECARLWGQATVGSNQRL